MLTTSCTSQAVLILGKYSETEVRRLLENYEGISHRRSFDYLHAKLIDLDRSLALLRYLQPKAFTAALLVGILGFDVRTAGELTGTSKDTMRRRYVHAIKTMTQYLNLGRTK